MDGRAAQTSGDHRTDARVRAVDGARIGGSRALRPQRVAGSDTPAVYVAVAAAAVGVWLAADATLDGDSVSRALAALGGVFAAGAIVAVGTVGVAGGSLSPVVPAAGLVVASVLSGVVWVGLTHFVPTVHPTGALGAFVIFAHVLDGVSTAVGVDVLGFGERTPLSRIIIEFAAGLPTEPVLGTVWLFVVVKIAVASHPVSLVGTLVGAVGLGPAVHNLLLFSVATPA